MVILAPLPFGMVYGLFQAGFACAVWGLVIAYCALQVRPGRRAAVSLKAIAPESVGFLLVLCWAVIQMLPVTPQTWHHPMWSEAGAALGLELAGSISLTCGAGLESLLRLASYGAVFWLALQWGRDRKQAARLVGAAALAGTVYALYGLAMHFGGLTMVLWVEKTAYLRDVTGTFINRNSFATYAGLCLLCAAGLYLTGFLKALQTARKGRDRMLYLLQQAFVRGAPLLAASLILLTALFLTNSRAGVTASLAALLVLIVFLGPLSRQTGRLYKAITLSLLGAALAIFFLSGEAWLDRLTGTDLEREQRLHIYEQTWQAVSLAPWTGYGLGGFRQVFPIFADETSTHWDKAHNDWLEMIFELGLPAALLWFAVFIGLAVRCLIGFFTRRRDNVYPLIGFCASILVALHALVDFSLQIPGVAVTFATLLGVGVAQSRSSREGR